MDPADPDPEHWLKYVLSSGEGPGPKFCDLTSTASC
jgi:hypothetical protein